MLPQEIVDAICEYGDYRGEQFGGAPRTADPYKALEAAIEKTLAGERSRCAREIAIPETVGEAHRLARGAMAWTAVAQEASAIARERAAKIANGGMEWIRLADLRLGAIFETKDGIRAVKTEYQRPRGGCQCVLLESGEYAHFGEAHDEMMVREIRLGEVTKPNPLSVDTIRVWFSGPTTVRDEREARTVGEYEDLPASTTTAHVYHPDRDPPLWERSTISTDQEARLSNVWILRGDKWTACRIEPKIDTAVRHAVDAAVLAERTAAKGHQDALVAIAKLGEREGCAQELIRLLGVCADNIREGAGRTEALLSGVAAIRARG